MTTTEAPTPRVCRRCEVAKPTTDYSRKANRKDGLQVNCKPCSVILNREWREAHPGAQARHTRNWEAKNPEKVAEMRARAKASGYGRDYNRRARYGLSREAFDALLASQGSVCASCATAPENERWHVDHDHACCPGGKSCGQCVRGILCFRCNAGIGVFQDDAEALRQAADYLDRIRARDLEERPPLTPAQRDELMPKPPEPPADGDQGDEPEEGTQ